MLLRSPWRRPRKDCQAIIDAAEQSGATLMLAHRLHQEPGTVEMIEKVRDQKVIGDPRYFTAAFSRTSPRTEPPRALRVLGRAHPGPGHLPAATMGVQPLPRRARRRSTPRGVGAPRAVSSTSTTRWP
ncbi:hypothetical protein QJS66_12840 [Kocuria rhizophila]|nr:hypothetical protein QJS66_12840 [Kocuria rhizophila]